MKIELEVSAKNNAEGEPLCCEHRVYVFREGNGIGLHFIPIKREAVSGVSVVFSPGEYQDLKDAMEAMNNSIERSYGMRY